MIGIFGGTFDPVHHGHLRIALDALEFLDLEKIHLVPLARAVHRAQPHANAQQRLAMLQHAVAGQPALVADDREIRRGGDSFMMDTLQSLRAELPDQGLCLLLGSDAFNGFMHWRSPHRILELANILVMQRPGYTLPDDPRLCSLVDVHRQEDLQAFRGSANGGIHFHDVTQLDISSSDIRRRIADGRNPAYLLPRAVIAYIEAHRLYR
jgi:nicotinate-nucleotide adenylyltransferase